MDNDLNKIYEKRTKRILISIIVLVLIILYIGIKFLDQENICNKKAYEKLGNDFNKTIIISNAEAKKLGIIENNEIFLGFKDSLECEKSFRYLIP